MVGNIELTIRDNGVAIVEIDQKGNAHNVFTSRFVDELDEVLDEISSNDLVRGVVLTSGKPGTFFAGADVNELIEMYEKGCSAQDCAAWSAQPTRVFRRLETLGVPVASALNGVALGGGFELALACHHRVLSDAASAVVGLPEVGFGLMPGAGGVQRLVRLIGVPAALPILLAGKTLTPAAAMEAGLVEQLCPEADVCDAAEAWVLEHPDAVQPWDQEGFRIPGGTGALAPHAGTSFMAGTAQVKGAGDALQDPARKTILSSVFEGSQLPIDTALALDTKYFGRLLAGPVPRNKLRTLFVNKARAAKLEWRPDAPKLAVRTVGIIGAGMMGSGIAQAAASAGLNVILIDRTLEEAEKGKENARGRLDKLVAKGKLAPAKAAETVERILVTTEFGSLANCELVIEAVFESREAKTEIYQRLESVVAEDCVIGTNTSTLPITGLSEVLARPERFIGVHFFSPVDRMPLVEVILGDKTASQTLAHALDFVSILRKTPIVVGDGPGFFTSRVFCAYIDEGMAMLREGISPALIERAARMAGFPVGPLAVTDEVSLDLQKLVMDQAAEDGLPVQFQRNHARDVVDELVGRGRLGRKSGGGFFEYGAHGKRIWPGLVGLFPQKNRQPAVEEVERRLTHIQALESLRCLEEDIIDDPVHADLGSVLGIGFPAWTGGTLSYVETVGMDRFLNECEDIARSAGQRFKPSPWMYERARKGQPIEAA